MKRILVVGSQHGNEVLGEHLYEYLQAHGQFDANQVAFYLANPPARKLLVRYVDADMNRSYGLEAVGQEAVLAQELKKYIEMHDFDLVIDAHTTTCIEPPCLIVPSRHEVLLPFIQASHISRIVVMPEQMTEGALIGVAPQAVSLEINERDVDDGLLDNLTQDVRRYVLGDQYAGARTVYEGVRPLYKTNITENAASKLINFEQAANGYYPILVGENSYKRDKDYYGFCATVAREFTV